MAKRASYADKVLTAKSIPSQKGTDPFSRLFPAYTVRA